MLAPFRTGPPRLLQGHPGFTSRDIAGLAVLPADARSAFSRLAAAVERLYPRERWPGAPL